jgi:hypothetical protein
MLAHRLRRRPFGAWAATLGAQPAFCYVGSVKTTQYFNAIRTRPDRARIRDEWIERAIQARFAKEFKLTVESGGGSRCPRKGVVIFA